MNSYMGLIARLAGLDRCHNGPEMAQAYAQLVAFYPGARLLAYPTANPVNHWRLPPHWTCPHRDGTLLPDLPSFPHTMATGAATSPARR